MLKVDSIEHSVSFFGRGHFRLNNLSQSLIALFGFQCGIGCFLKTTLGGTPWKYSCNRSPGKEEVCLNFPRENITLPSLTNLNQDSFMAQKPQVEVVQMQV